jgi:PAS domain S-box-containing protein
MQSDAPPDFGPKNIGAATNSIDDTLRLVLDSSPFGISIIPLNNPDKRLFVNKRMAEMFGFEADEDMLFFAASDSYVNPEDVKKMRRSRVEGDFLTEFEVERYRKDGTRWWCHLYRRPAKFEGEDVIVAWHADITDRKLAEAALADNMATLQAIFDNTPLNMNLKDGTGRYQLINKVYASWYGLTPQEIIGKRASEFFFDAPMVDSLDEIESNVLDTGETREYEVRIKGKDGAMYDRRVIKFPVITGDGKASSIGTITIDITEHKENERKLLEAKESADAANQSKSEFLAHMSHELRTPLNAIIGFSQILSEDVFGEQINAKYREYACDIQRSGEHLVSLVNGILDLSKVEAGETEVDPTRFLLAHALDECIKLFEYKNLPGSQRIQAQVSKEASYLYADARLFRQIIYNLLSNAIKYTPDGGEILIASGQSLNGATTVEIRDSGVGIAPEDIERVQEPFGQARAHAEVTHEGTGLGLSLSKKLMELQGGSLEIESEIGIGTTVILEFPPEK